MPYTVFSYLVLFNVPCTRAREVTETLSERKFIMFKAYRR